jgi:hypothetical protein
LSISARVIRSMIAWYCSGDRMPLIEQDAAQRLAERALLGRDGDAGAEVDVRVRAFGLDVQRARALARLRVEHRLHEGRAGLHCCNAAGGFAGGDDPVTLLCVPR